MKPSKNNKKSMEGSSPGRIRGGGRSKMVGNTRLLALNALSEVLDEGRFLSECMSLKDDESNRNLPQARHLAYGVLRWLVALAWLESQLLDKPLKQKDQDISRLIWLGLFQSCAGSSVNRLLCWNSCRRPGNTWLTRTGCWRPQEPTGQNNGRPSLRPTICQRHFA
jgi:hypothetical protein